MVSTADCDSVSTDSSSVIRPNFKDKMLNPFKKPYTPKASELSDAVLLCEIANMMDWSEEKVLRTACIEAKNNHDYDKYFSTKKLPMYVRLELRKAYSILIEEF